MRRRLEIFVLMILAITSAVANTPVENPEKWSQSKHTVSEYRITFQTFPVNFDYNGVRSILRDCRGYMWFGTEDGLVRFDGIHLYLYEHIEDDSTSLVHNEVNTIVEDNKGNLWIGTSKGLSLYNRDLDNFVNLARLYPQLTSLYENYISDLFVDDDSLLWIATFGDGFYIFNPRDTTLLHFTDDPQNPESSIYSRVTRIVIRNEKVWLGTDNGLCLFEQEDGNFRYYRNVPANPASLSNNSVVSLRFDSSGELWVGTRGGGINRLIEQNEEYRFKRYVSNDTPGSLSNNVVISIAEDTRGNLWFGTENGGLNLFIRDEERFEVFRVEEGNNQSLNSNSIWSLYSDREGRIWIGTANRGINVIDNNYNKFDSYQKNPVKSQHSLSHNDVRAFAEDDKGNIWIGTDGGGICLFEPASHVFAKQIYNTDSRNLIENNAVQSILFDDKKNLWIGMWDGGIDLLNSSGKRIKHYSLVTEEGIEIRNVRVIYQDSKNNIWAGSVGKGLFKYNKIKDHFEPANCSNSSDVLNEHSFVTCLLEDSEGYYWIGTRNGLVLATYNDDQFLTCEEIISDNPSNSIGRQIVQVIYQDIKGRIWVGTRDHGLRVIDRKNKKTQVFKKQDGLHSNVIYGILEDDEGYLWITTNRGITRFHYESLSFTNYTREDGLNSNEFYINSCLRTSRGEFFIGGENGFNVFYPGNILRNKVIPPVCLSDLKIHNIPAKIGVKSSPLEKHIAETNKIRLTHKQSSFTIEFVALNYTRPKKNRFIYKLEGLDENWIEAGNNYSASYTNIKPGKYVFMVKGSNNDGIWNPEPRRLEIRILPPVWKTWWAYLFYFLLLAGLSLLAFKVRQERIAIKNQLMLEKMAKEKEHELNEENIQYFTNISHEFRTPLSLIIGPLENLINSTQEGIKDQLRIIQRNASRLLHLTNNLMNFRKFEEGGIKLNVQEGDILNCLKDISNYFSIRIRRRKLKLIIESNESVINGWFDAEKLETILLNLLSNAIKFTPDGGLINIVINCHEPASLIKIFDKKIAQDFGGFRHLELRVTDQGSGISSEDLPYIFEKFYQAKNSGVKRQTGTGIGLSLTRGLTEIHHGRIWAQSVPGKETSFTVVIPIDRGAYADHEVFVQPGNEIEKNIVKADFEYTSTVPAEAYSGDESGEKPEILIVEDNDELRLFLVRELGKEYNIKQAEDGELGIDMAFNLVPDLIVTDVLMPRLGGFELCKTVKSDIRTSHIPLILLTAKTTIHDQIEGVEMGADAYITKPFSIELLQKQINHLIQSRRKLYAQFSQDVYLLPNKLSDNEMDQEFLQKSIDYILQNISDERLNVEGLAVELNLNRSNVYRKIKALTGNSVVEFIRSIRLKQAIKLMETNKYSLSEIAYQTGFTSPSYFTKMFKRKYGTTPSEYINS